MDDEILKRRTDCVYFLASPLTCKKGNECEFRHSENARLNPRDCYYWRNGNCRNPICAFRHPPLEGSTIQGPNLGQATPSAAVDPSKPNVPCYFYFNSYCIKGDQCPFLHEMSPKLPKAAPEPSSMNPPQIKTSAGSDTGPPSVEVAATANPNESTSELVKQVHSKEAQVAVQDSVYEEGGTSSESAVPECEEPGMKSIDGSLPPVEYINGNNEHPSQDQSSEDPEKEYAEQEEWWESSPGFDVLVDDGSEQLYQDDPEYLLARERESELLNSHLLPYEFEGSVGYDLMGYPDVGYDPYDHLERRRTPEYFETGHDQSRERFLEPIIHRQRKGLHSESEEDDRGRADLRDLLRKRRRMDVHYESHSSRKHRSSRARGNSRERPIRSRIGPPLNGRLSLEPGNTMSISSRNESESLWNDDRHRHDRHRQGRPGPLGYPQLDRYDRTRHRERESKRKRAKSPPIHSESSRSSVKEARPRHAPTAGFSAPKTLAQIREENRAKANNNVTENSVKANDIVSGNGVPRRSRGVDSAEFEGPKPLNELLKGKKTHTSVTVTTSSHTEKGVLDVYRSTSVRQDKYDSRSLDEDDEDYY